MSYPARTIAGEEVQIVSKTPNAAQGEILGDADGNEYVLDFATGYLVPITDAPVTASSLTPAEEAAAHKDPENAPQGDPILS